MWTFICICKPKAEDFDNVVSYMRQHPVNTEHVHFLLWTDSETYCSEWICLTDGCNCEYCLRVHATATAKQQQPCISEWEETLVAGRPILCSRDIGSSLTPSTPAVPNCCCSKGSASYWSKPSFLIFDIRALWRSVLSARAPECQKLKMVG